MSHYSIVLHKGGMRFFKNGCNGGMENFLLEICEEARNEGGGGFIMGGWEISLYIVGRGVLTLYFMKTPCFAYPPPF